MRTFAVVCTAIIAVCTLSALQSCQDETVTETYTVREPVYQSWEDFTGSSVANAPQELVSPGKIWVYNEYLLIAESGKGIHIIDNGNPANPQFVGFIPILGNVDMAVRDNILYADSYNHLLAYDISDPTQVRGIGGAESVFLNYEIYYDQSYDPTLGIVVDWNERTMTRTISRRDDAVAVDASADVFNSESFNPDVSQGGSLARFTIVDNFLYVVGQTDLKLFRLNDPINPALWATIEIGWGVETIFPFKDKLFIGSQTGMFIFDNSNPANPTQISQFLHVVSCDPVVADDDYAYVTLRNGTNCRQGSNQLDIIDISDITNPSLTKSYAMHNPHGLGVKGNTLFICDADAGLKVFDATDVENLEIRDHISENTVYDIIPIGDIAIVIGPDGLYQYDCSDPQNLALLSTIALHSEG